MKRNYDLKTNVRSFKEGDPVYVLDTASVKGKCRKLSPTWKGPGLIVKKLSDYIYTIKLRGKESNHNHDRIKLCRDKNLPLWIKRQKEGKSGSVNTTSTYCLCGGPDDGSFMIQCHECREWFHGRCVNLTPELAKAIDDYECPQCTN